ncbi:MAG: fatty acid hydroxylase [Anaeromyxobacter sp.]
MLLPAIVGLLVVWLALSTVHDLAAWQLAAVPAFLLFSNAVEWHAHRGLLHRRVRFLEVLYVRHTPQHHALYVNGEMAIHTPQELRFILLPAYGLLAILGAASPITALLLWAGQPNLAALWVVTVVAYVLAYEWLHLAYHLPEESPIGRLGLVRVLRRHHQLHHTPHLMQRWNFNVTVPVWDVVRGTVYHPEIRHYPASAPAAAPSAARRLH